MAYRQEYRQGQEGVHQQQQQEQEQQRQQQEFVGPTLCISRTHKNIREGRIFAVLRQLNLGWVGKIDMVPKKIVEKNPDGTETTKEFVRVFIHFTKWFTQHHQTQQFLERLDSEGFVRIVYDEPWYWNVTKHVPKEHKPQPQSRYPRPRIDFGTTTATTVVKKPESKELSSSSVSAPIVPVQVTRPRRLQNITTKSVSVSGGSGSELKKKYWAQQAETATAVVMAAAAAKHHSASPTPRSRDSSSDSSPSPFIQRHVSMQLFSECN